MSTAWILLTSAIVVEVAATASLPRTDGFRHLWWSVAVLVGYAVAIWLLALVVRDLPVSIVYAIWSGLGTAGIAVVGALFLGDRIDLVRAGAIAMIIAGVVILNLHGAGAH
jgi:small multidrug resistance pump